MSLLLEEKFSDVQRNFEIYFQETSIEIGSRINITNGDVTKILDLGDGSVCFAGNCLPLSPGIDNSTGKQIGKWGEGKIKFLFNGFKSAGPNHLYDLSSEDSVMEVKTCKKGNACIIRENQLIEISNIEGMEKYYALVFYKVKNKQKVSELLVEDLHSNLIPSEIYILPLEYLIHYYNEPNTKKIVAKGGFFKKIHQRTAEKLFNLDAGKLFEREIFNLWGIDIKIINYSGENFDINKASVKKIKGN